MTGVWVSPGTETHNRFARWLGGLLARQPTHARRKPVVIVAKPTPFKPTPAAQPVDVSARKMGAQPTPKPTHADPTGSPENAETTRAVALAAAVSRGTAQPVPLNDQTSVFGVDYDGDVVPSPHQRRSWMTADGNWHAELKQHHQSEHATRLLEYVQVARPQILDFPTLLDNYCDMCIELCWAPHSWVKVARHFTPLSGGKQYRQVFDHSTGRKSARERIYIIPPAAPARTPPPTPQFQSAPPLAEPLRRAA